MDSPVVKWLKRLFSLKTLEICIAVAGVLLAYYALQREDGGVPSIVSDGEVIPDGTELNLTVITAEDKVDLSGFDMIPHYANNMNHAVKNMLLKEQMVFDDGVQVALDRDSEWGYTVDGYDVTFTYKGNTLYPHTDAPRPFNDVILSENSKLRISSTMTYEGCERPVGYTLTIGFALVRPLEGEDFDAWAARAEALVAPPDNTTMFFSGLGYEQTKVYDNSVAGQDNRPTELVSGHRVTPLIENLEDARFEFYGDSAQANFKASYAPPGRKGYAVAVFSGLYGGDSADVPFYELMVSDKYRRYSFARLLLIDSCGNAVIGELPPYFANKKFIGFARLNPGLGKEVTVSGDTLLLNGSDRPAVICLGYIPEGTDEVRFSTRLLEPGESTNISSIVTQSSEYAFEVYEAPERLFSDRHSITAYTISFVLAIIFLFAFLFIVDKDSRIPKAYCLIPALLFIILFWVWMKIDLLL